MSKSSVRWTLDEYTEYQRRNGLKTNPPLQDSKPECHAPPALDSVAAGKEKSLRRVTLRFTGYRVKPLDPDNFAGSVKDCIDGLKAARLIHDDSPEFIRLETEQVKVSSYSKEKTEIEIRY